MSESDRRADKQTTPLRPPTSRDDTRYSSEKTSIFHRATERNQLPGAAGRSAGRRHRAQFAAGHHE